MLWRVLISAYCGISPVVRFGRKKLRRACSCKPARKHNIHTSTTLSISVCLTIVIAYGSFHWFPFQVSLLDSKTNLSNPLHSSHVCYTNMRTNQYMIWLCMTVPVLGRALVWFLVQEFILGCKRAVMYNVKEAHQSHWHNCHFFIFSLFICSHLDLYC